MRKALQMTEHGAAQVEAHSVAGEPGPMLGAVGARRRHQHEGRHRAEKYCEFVERVDSEAESSSDPDAPSIDESIDPGDFVLLNQQNVDDVFECEGEREWEVELQNSHHAGTQSQLHMRAHE